MKISNLFFNCFKLKIWWLQTSIVFEMRVGMAKVTLSDFGYRLYLGPLVLLLPKHFIILYINEVCLKSFIWNTFSIPFQIKTAIFFLRFIIFNLLNYLCHIVKNYWCYLSNVINDFAAKTCKELNEEYLITESARDGLT